MRTQIEDGIHAVLFSLVACGSADASLGAEHAEPLDAPGAANVEPQAGDAGVPSVIVRDAGTGSPIAARFPGQPPAGKVLWGAAISGNGDPVARDESVVGHPLTVHRTYFQWSQRSTAVVTTATDDVAHHRVPWVSVKPPSWAAMGAGTYDLEIDQMLNALAAVPGPVWLTVHHEPEGGGGNNAPDDPAGPSGHVAMNARIRMRMTALGTKNIALAPVLMSYTWVAASGRDPNAWWKPGIYDFIGIDHYRDAEATLLDPTWSTVRSWARTKGTEIAVGEWGMRGVDAAAGLRVHDWYNSAAGSNADGAGARVIGLAAFDSSLNSPSGSWELNGAQRTAFQSLLADPRTAVMAP